jgi:serine/threonine-protein kinase
MTCHQCGEPLPGGARFCQSCGGVVGGVDPLLGRVLGEKYRLLKKLGEGGFGVVYAAEHVGRETAAAVKLIHPHLARDAEVLERFRREALAAGRLEHPLAVRIYGWGKTRDGLSWIAMERLFGQTLDARLSEAGALPEREVVGLLSPLCEVLAEAHAKGIVHRDLKPDNIMLTPGEGGVLPRVLDFGIAGLADAATLTGPEVVSGSPQYMAPEQWQGLTRADARSDIYALGVIAFQALSGRLPVEAESPTEWLKKHRAEAPLDLGEAMIGRPLSPAVRGAIMRAIAKDPAARHESALGLKRALTG